jgi:hypothetical protein
LCVAAATQPPPTGAPLNKRKKVAWHKHLKKAKKAEAKRKANR